mgnify:FL=1
MYRNFIRKNTTSVSIVLFLILFLFIQNQKPAFIYEEDGSFRQFGIGFKKKTVIPIWLMTFILAIFSYLFTLYYVNLPNYKF